TFISEVINRLGEESSKAQKLQIPITTTTKFTADTNDDLIYLMFARCNVSKQSRFKEIGFIRFGKRDLYFDDGTSLKHLVNCPSILGYEMKLVFSGHASNTTQIMNEMTETDGDGDEEVRTGYFGIRSYLHHFYENSREYDEHATEL
ncbi:hypothetical protein BLA29_001853, partial [Euroglyphus maynei]